MSKWFYLIDVAADLEIVAGVLGLVILIATAIITAICFSEAYDEEDEEKIIKRGIKYGSIGLVLILIVIVVPSKNAMYQMMIASYLADNDLPIEVEHIKQAVDYIVSQLG